MSRLTRGNRLDAHTARFLTWGIWLLACLWAPRADAIELKFQRTELLAGYTSPAPPPPDTPGTAFHLPGTAYADPAEHSRRSWIRLRFELAETDRKSLYGVYLQKIAPGGALYMNGTYIGATKELGRPHVQTWNYPLYLAFPATLLHSGSNELLIEVVSPYGTEAHYAALGPIMIGSDVSLYPRYRARLHLQVTGVEIVSLLVGLIGLFVAVLWWRRKRDVVFGLFALACGLWIVRNSQFFLVDTYLSAYHFAIITDAMLFWLVAVLLVMSFRILERRFARLERALFIHAFVATSAMCAAGPSYIDLVTDLLFAVEVVIGALFLCYLTALTWRRANVLCGLLWLAAIVTSSTGGYDLLLMLKLPPWPAAYLMPYSALLFALTVGWALIDRFVVAHNQFEHLNVNLEAQVHQREQELVSHYRHVAGLEREQAIATERERILRDMHDGLGLQLISSMRLAEKSALSGSQVSALFGDAMDELRIAIDSLKPTAQDLLVMLGNLRYRLEPRLNAADITLRWDIDVASGLRPMPAEHVADVTRIVQEGIANAMKHARATELRLKVEAPAAGGLRVTLMDNGRGFDPNRPHHGEGLTSMLKRAHKIGAALDITSEPGGTCIAVTLGPLAKTDPPVATVLPAASRNSPVASFAFRTLARKTDFHGRFRTASRACPPG